jgi:CRISPR-associated endonuclease/helicase Cas3
MAFYSHSKKLPTGEISGIKTLERHTKNVVQNSLQLFSENVSFSYPNEELKNLITIIAKFHDLGKYIPDFQNYLLGKPFNQELKNHSRFGAYAAFCKLLNKSFNYALIAYLIIVRHHNNLINFINDSIFRDINQNSLNETFEKQKSKVDQFIREIENELNESNLHSLLQFPFECFGTENLRRKVRRLSRELNCENYFLINYLFSLLIEADKLDASENEIYVEKEIPTDLVNGYLSNLSYDKLKEEVRNKVLSKLETINISEDKLFTLTAPTGIGKTITGLNFALELRYRMSKNGKKSKIIYALPFINIIEQNLKVYNDVLKRSAKVIAHYQFSGDDFFKEKNNNEIEEGKNYRNKLMLLETWQADVVITSFVQFAETIISNKNKALKKFAHFADAIVILDEVQAIDVEKLPLIGAVIYFLSKYLNTRFLLMTATKPYVFELAEKLTNGSVNYIELLDNHKEVFNKFNRTKIVPLGIESEIDEEIFIQIFEKKWERNKSCLIVANTVNRSLCLFEKMREYLREKNLNNPLYYLSTNILPANKLCVIEKIKCSLKINEAPILIATQTVEAGVDLDFDMGFRDIAPLDSIIQVAGRINRYNSKEKEGAPLYVVNFKDCKKIYGSIVEAIVSNLLSSEEEYPEDEYLEIISKYYGEITSEDKSSFDYSRKIFESICKLDYEDSRDGIPISSFQMIKENNFIKPVFIEIGQGEEALKKFIEFKQKEISKEEYLKFKSTFYSHIIKVPKKYLADIENHVIDGSEIILVDKDMLYDYYDSITGFKRENICGKKEEETLVL